nr:MAG TPA: hypothetical protein [Caudoviricetes sp.]
MLSRQRQQLHHLRQIMDINFILFSAFRVIIDNKEADNASFLIQQR